MGKAAVQGHLSPSPWSCPPHHWVSWKINLGDSGLCLRPRPHCRAVSGDSERVHTSQTISASQLRIMQPFPQKLRICCLKVSRRWLLCVDISHCIPLRVRKGALETLVLPGKGRRWRENRREGGVFFSVYSTCIIVGPWRSVVLGDTEVQFAGTNCVTLQLHQRVNRITHSFINCILSSY